MAVYAIGDVQGCYDSLLRLLEKLRYDDTRDELWFCGDLVNRGPNSAEVVRFIRDLRRSCVVLGNHDLHLLAVSMGFRKSKRADTFSDVLNAPDRDELLNWLRAQPLAFFDEKKRVLLVHAGLHPAWGLSEGLAKAREVEALMGDEDTFHELLQRMYGDSSALNDADPFDRARSIINAFTRMRFCSPDGNLDFDHFGAPGSQPADLVPWFTLREEDDFRIVFGHWSMLGPHVHRNTIGLDGGCVHGGKLSAIDTERDSIEFVQVSCID